MQSNKNFKKVNRFFFSSVFILILGLPNLFAQFPNYSGNLGSTTAFPSTIQNIQQGQINTKKRQIIKNDPLQQSNDSTFNSRSFKKDVNLNTSLKNNPTEKSDTLEKMIFGKTFFQQKNLLFQPNLKVATPQSYVVGPDDELIIDIFGYSEEHYNLTVTSDGVVKIPKVGLIQVNGLTIQEVKRKIISRLSRIFVGLKSEGSGVSATNLYATITLGNIRQINVLVQGEVENPGSYSVSSLTKAINVLYQAGGPTVNGTFRNIELIRNNKVIGKIDLYDYLIGGILKNDFTLQDQDILKVGLYENRVTLQGKVKRPLIYEFLKDEKLDRIIQHFGGGFADDAFKQNVKLVRYTSKERKILDINYDLANSVSLESGDIISIESINTERFENRIKITGEVWRPGFYSLENCPTILKLIEKSGGFKDNAFLSRVLIKRLRADNFFENISINLSNINDKNFKDFALKREDEVFVQGIDLMREDYTVTIHGEVNFKQNEETTSSGKLTSASLNDQGKNNTLTTENKNSDQNLFVSKDQIIEEDEISEDFKSNEANNKLLNRQTKLTIPFVANMTVEDLIVKSGGLRESANSGFVEIVRRNKNSEGENQSKIGEIFNFAINKDLTINETASKFKLEPFDEVFIRSSSSYQIQQFVTLKGEVKYPGVYGLEVKDEKISSLIKRSGNLTFTANIEGASLLRKRKKSEIDNLIRKDQFKNLENNFVGSEIAKENDDINFEKIGINLTQIIKNPGGYEDLIVEDGDILDIPILKQTVKITGEVIHPTTITFKSNYNLKDYINHSGGFTQKSARNKGYVIYANGSINRTKHFLFFKNYPKILPGSEIVVPTYNKNTQQMASLVNIYTGTLTSIISVYLLLKATIN